MATSPINGTGRIRGPVNLTNALIAVIREEGFQRILEKGTGFDGSNMVLTLAIDISPKQLESAAALLQTTLKAKAV